MNLNDKIEYIPLAIPQELKDMFESDYKMLLQRYAGLGEGLFINKHLLSNNVLEVSKCINEAYMPIESNGTNLGDGVEKEGFFKEFPEWLDFAIDKIIAEQSIELSNRKGLTALDVFRETSQWLEGYRMGDVIQRKNEIKKQLISSINRRSATAFNPYQLRNAIDIFLNLATRDVKAEDLADISYAAFQNAREKESSTGE